MSGIFIHDQATCLARRFHVTVLTPRSPSVLEHFFFRWGAKFFLKRDHGIDTLHVRRLRLPSIQRLFMSRQDPDYIMPYYRRFCRAIRKGFSWYVGEYGRPDIIHAHVVLPAGWIAVELGREYGVPVVLTEHSGPFSMHLDSQAKHDLVRRTLAGADRLVAVSPALRDAMRQVCPDAEIDVIGNIIDTEFFVPGKPTSEISGQVRLLAVSALNEKKGIQHLLSAAQHLLAKGYRAFEIRIGGDGPYRSRLEAMARELGVQHHCRFLGTLTREAVRAHMQACDLFVLPSLGETFGVVLVEAMSCGKPVLATRCGGPDTLVTPETGILVAPGDPSELAQAMAEFMTGRRRYDADAIRRSAVTRFAAAAFLSKIEAVYREVSANRAPPAVARCSAS